MSLLQSHSAAGKMGISGWPGRGRVPCSRRLWHGRGVAPNPCQLQNADCDAGLSMLPILLQCCGYPGTCNIDWTRRQAIGHGPLAVSDK